MGAQEPQHYAQVPRAVGCLNHLGPEGMVGALTLATSWRWGLHLTCVASVPGHFTCLFLSF